MSDTVKNALVALVIALLGAAGGGSGAYLATKPADPAAALQKGVAQFAIVENMTGLCMKIDKPVAAKP
jgi:hypothetical protein